MRQFLQCAAAILCLAAGAAAAAEPSTAPLRGLTDCGGVAGAAEKAVCYDAATAALTRAVQTGEIIIVARKEAQAAQRGAFGFDLPAFNIFDRGAGGAAKPLESVTGEAKRAYRDQHDHWVVVLADGAIWRQIDSERISPSPRQGSTVEIRKAAFGSYMMKIDGQRGVRARRGE